MSDFILTAESRDLTGRKTDALRAEGSIPAVVYGFGTEPLNLTLDRNTVEKMYKTAGESTVIDLQVDGNSHNVLIQDIQRDALTGFITHADFRAIDMNKQVEATISLQMVGEAPAVKELGGTLIQSLEEVDVRALPAALVALIEVDATALKTFDDVVRVADLTIPEGIELLTDENQTVASVTPPRTEAEMAALDEAVEADVSEVEVEGEKKAEGEEAQKEEEGKAAEEKSE